MLYLFVPRFDVVESRSAQGHLERLSELAADLVRLGVDVLVTQGTVPTLAARDVTKTVPIVMFDTADPVPTASWRASRTPEGFQQIEIAAPTLGVTVQSVRVASSDDFDRAFAAIGQGRPGGLIVLYGPLRGDDLPRIVEFETRTRVPTVFELGQGVRGGASWSSGRAPRTWPARSVSARVA